jgi:hypothetical protein
MQKVGQSRVQRARFTVQGGGLPHGLSGFEAEAAAFVAVRKQLGQEL